MSVEQLYRIEKPVSDGGYLVLPHGSGYLIPADCPDELPGQGPRRRIYRRALDAAAVRDCAGGGRAVCAGG